MSILNAPYFQNEAAAYAKLESIVWPHGPVCPHCGTMELMKRMGGEATRPELYKRSFARLQFLFNLQADLLAAFGVCGTTAYVHLLVPESKIIFHFALRFNLILVAAQRRQDAVKPNPLANGTLPPNIAGVNSGGAG